MAVIKCKMCGGDLILTEGNTVAECEYCGTVQTVPNADDEKKLTLFARANRLRAACEFDKAAGLYESIAAEFPEEAEAYWGLILCKYGIEYVDDPATGKKIPTCHRSSFDSVMEDEAFEQVMEYSDINSRRVYREEAKFIEELRKNIIEVSGKEAPYDIFICYKETDPNGERTVDSVMAQEIYDKLTADGYRVFFSRITLEDKLGQEYEPYIFAALNSAKVMLAFGTDYEYYNAVWVKNEWSRFLKLMEKDKSRHLIPCYKGIDAYDMPKEFARLQAQDMGKVGADQDLLRGIRKLLPKQEAKAETVIVQQAAPANSTAPLLKRAFMFLEDGAWTSANEYCEKVLDQDPENVEAYLGKLMAELRVTNRKKLADCAAPFNDRDNFAKVIRFGDEALEKEMRGYITHINERNENARLTGIYENAQCTMQNAQSEEAYKKAAEIFKSISGFKDADALAEQCLKKAEEQKSEAEAVYDQLIEALKNSGKAATLKSQLEDAENKKQELEESLDEQLRKFETDKNTFRSNTSFLDRKRNELQSLNLKKQEIDRKISDLEKQISSLGIFAISKKNVLRQEIENLSAEKRKLSDGIDELQKELGSVMAVLEALGSETDIDNRAETLTQDLKVKIQAADNEIERLKQKLEEEKTSDKQRISLPEIVREITTKKYISAHIRNDSKKAHALAQFINLPNQLCILFGLPFSFGSYPQGKNGERAPIEWIVLAKKDNKILATSKYALDYQQYHTEWVDITWENCSLRKWMNDTFINTAFTAEEQTLILDSKVSADKNPEYSTNPGNATKDKVFLLSITEVEKYFSSDGARQCKHTDYAVANRAHVNSDNGNCSWWLRSPGNYQNYAADVSRDGSVRYGGFNVDIDFYGVRPALWINLDS